MSTSSDGALKAFVQTAEHTGGFVWIITLVDFAARDVRRSLVSEDVWATRAAAQDAGEARLAAMAADR